MSKKKILFSIFLFFFFLGSFSLSYFIRKNFFSKTLKNSSPVNFLILGLRGFETNGNDLTDTILFVSLNPQTKKAVFLSLPRDIWLESLKAKINTAYHYGGILLAKKAVAEVTGQEIDYYLVVDFNAFGKIVDAIGGVTVDVQRSFDDYYYPIPGKENDPCNGDKQYKCRYEHIHFDAGPQFMNGQIALKYVRSRNAEGEEGTDFARSLRQQQLLLAIKQKLLSPQFYLSPQKIKNLYQVIKENIVTDITPSQYGDLLLVLSKIDWTQKKSYILDENFLIHPKNHPSKQWVLISKLGNWEEIKKFVKEAIEN